MSQFNGPFFGAFKTHRIKDQDVYRYDRSSKAHPLKCYFKASAEPDGAIAAIMHGYRGNPDGENNEGIAGQMEEQGLATLKVGFSGYDHYGMSKAPDTIDDATFLSNLEDLKIVLSTIPETRPVILVANSGSINIAHSAAAEYPNVSHILAVSPFPNIVDFIRRARDTIPLMKKRLDEKGRVIPPGYDPRCKITKRFLDVGQPADLFNADALRGLNHKPRLMTVRSEADKALKDWDLMPWLDASQKAGYVVEDLILAGDAHALDDPLLEAIAQQASFIMKDLG